MLDDKGFSLVELIICVAIMAILATGALSLTGMIKYANIKKSAGELDVALEKARMNTIAKAGSPYFYIYKKGGAYYYKLTEETILSTTGGTKFAGEGTEISYKEKGSSVETMISEGSPLKMKFLKSTGGLTDNGTATICESIHLSGDGDYVIKMVEKTGKHYME